MKHPRRAARAAAPQKSDSSAGLMPGKFHLEAPLAKSVKLAAPFTEWEKNPLDLVKAENGTWLLVLPLPPGEHPYRFIVDGEWMNDPNTTRKISNPFGTENSVKLVA